MLEEEKGEDQEKESLFYVQTVKEEERHMGTRCRCCAKARAIHAKRAYQSEAFAEMGGTVSLERDSWFRFEGRTIRS